MKPFGSVMRQVQILRLIRSLIAVVVSICLGLPNLAFSRSADDLRVFWTRPIASEQLGGLASGIVILDIARAAAGPVVLLARDAGRLCLLTGADDSGPGQQTFLSLNGTNLRISAGVGDVLWIGGFTNHRYAGIASGDVSDAYLVKLDRSGRILWERTFGGDSRRTIESIAALSSGDIVVAGRDNERTWLARVSADGRVIWERFNGTGRSGASVAVVGNRILLAAFEADSKDAAKAFVENVAVWSFDELGILRAHQVIRESMNNDRGSSSGRIFIVGGESAAYVFSAWSDFMTAKAIETAKVDVEGHVAWRREIAESLPDVPKDVHIRLLTWSTAVTLVGQGNPLITLPIKGRVLTLEIDTATGEVSQRSWSAGPDCYKSAATSLFAALRGAQLWILGSREAGFSGTSCTWLGQLSFAQKH